MSASAVRLARWVVELRPEDLARRRPLRRHLLLDHLGCAARGSTVDTAASVARALAARARRRGDAAPPSSAAAAAPGVGDLRQRRARPLDRARRHPQRQLAAPRRRHLARGARRGRAGRAPRRRPITRPSPATRSPAASAARWCPRRPTRTSFHPASFGPFAAAAAAGSCSASTPRSSPTPSASPRARPRGAWRSWPRARGRSASTPAGPPCRLRRRAARRGRLQRAGEAFEGPTGSSRATAPPTTWSW